MFPRLFQLGHFSLHTYGVLVATGVIVGLFVAASLARKQGQDPEKTWNLGIYMVLAGIVGAKLLMIINDFGEYSRHPAEIFSMSFLQAAGVFYGGVIGALVVAIWYVRANHMPVLRTCDAFAPGLAIGHSIGRLGCFAAGCCYGKPTSHWWGVTFHSKLAATWVGTPLNIPLEPTQLLESAFELVNFLFLYWLFKHKKFEGQIIGAYLFTYGVARFFLEFIRDDPDRGSVFGGALSGVQLIAIFMVIGGGLLWLRRAQLAPAPATARATR
ncbi:MAG: prolipoprotein diacylglyceryl transferase [Terriglobales bacterium]